MSKAAAGGQGGSWQTWRPHILVQINQEEQGGSETAQPRVPEQGNKAWNLWLKTPVGVEVSVGETPSLTGEFFGETHRVLELAQTHPLGNQHKKVPVGLWVVGEVTESLQRAEQGSLFHFRPLSHIQRQNAAPWVAPPWRTPKLCPLLRNRPTMMKKWPIWTDQSSRKNTTKQRRDSQPIRCTVQNTGNQDAHKMSMVAN